MQHYELAGSASQLKYCDCILPEKHESHVVEGRLDRETEDVGQDPDVFETATAAQGVGMSLQGFTDQGLREQPGSDLVLEEALDALPTRREVVKEQKN